jgi:hypothetical protein
MWLPFFGWGMAFMRPIAINRSAGRSAVEQVMTQGQERLAEGLNVVIYPEGTRVVMGAPSRVALNRHGVADRTLVPKGFSNRGLCGVGIQNTASHRSPPAVTMRLKSAMVGERAAMCREKTSNVQV